MKRKNIFGVILAAVLVLAGSCSKEPDMSVVDKWLGEHFNQELLWNMDSLAFHRADWTVQSVTDGVQMRKANVKMMGAMRSISYLAYSPDEFKTYVGYSQQTGTVAELAAAQTDALFAISGVSVPSYFKYNGSVVNPTTSDPSQINGVVAIPSSLANNGFSIYDCADGNYSSITEENAMATGAVLVVGGKEQVFPTGDYYDKRMARSIIGFNINSGNYVFATIDKGTDGQADGATIAEAAFIARMMGMTEAVCLADGDAAAIWSKESGVLNVPSSASPAKVASVLYVAVNEPALDGKGTADEPYIIDMAVKMKQMRKYSVAGGETYFKLAKDLDMSAIKTWFPVNWDGEFDRQIHFDGNGKTITNFSPNAFVDNVTGDKASYPSLFGVLYGSCKNLKVDKATINADGGCGVIGGYVGTKGKPAVVENVTITNSSVTSSGGTVGGVAGTSIDGSFKNVSYQGTVTCTAGANVGGLVGHVKSGSLSLIGCYVAGSVTGSGQFVGGLVGRADGSLSVSKSYTTGHVKTSDQKCGGLLGANGALCKIENSYSTSTIENTSRLNGGLVGYAGAEISIMNSYATGNVGNGQASAGILGNSQSPDGKTSVVGCIAWNEMIETASRTTGNYAPGAIVGSCYKTGTFKNCWRRPDMTFTDGADASKLSDMDDCVNAQLPLPDGVTGDHNRSYHGKAAGEDATVSSVAATLGWDETVWDLSSDLPELKIFK